MDSHAPQTLVSAPSVIQAEGSTHAAHKNPHHSAALLDRLDADEDFPGTSAEDSRRRHVKVACERCNRRHSACDNMRPCSSCVKAEAECVETTDRKKRGRKSKRPTSATDDGRDRRDGAASDAKNKRCAGARAGSAQEERPELANSVSHRQTYGRVDMGHYSDEEGFKGSAIYSEFGDESSYFSTSSRPHQFQVVQSNHFADGQIGQHLSSFVQHHHPHSQADMHEPQQQQPSRHSMPLEQMRSQPDLVNTWSENLPLQHATSGWQQAAQWQLQASGEPIRLDLQATPFQDGRLHTSSDSNLVDYDSYGVGSPASPPSLTDQVLERAFVVYDEQNRTLGREARGGSSSYSVPDFALLSSMLPC